jgi:hypothetical protein
MPQSESIAKLADALCKAQAMMKPAVKDTENPFFKSKYADLASVWDAIREPLQKNGLSITQLPMAVGVDQIGVRTVLMHASGEWVDSSFYLTPLKRRPKPDPKTPDVDLTPFVDPQSAGSAITYARRYALAAIMGVCTEDDDGEAATRLATVQNMAQAFPSGTYGQNSTATPPQPAGATAFLWRLGAHKNKPIEQIESGYLDWASKNMKADDHRQAAIAELMRRDGVSQPTLPEDEIPEFVEEDPAY